MIFKFFLFFLLCLQVFSAENKNIPACLAPLSVFDSNSSESLSDILSRLKKTVQESQLKALSKVIPSLKVLGFSDLTSEYLDGNRIQLADKSLLSIQNWFEGYHEGLYMELAENLQIPVDQRRYYKIECYNMVSALKSKRKLSEKRDFLNHLAEGCLSSQALRNMKSQIEKATSKVSYGKWQMKLVYDLIKIRYLQEREILLPIEKMTFLQMPVFSVDDNEQIRVDRMGWLRYKSSHARQFTHNAFKDPSAEWKEDLRQGRVKSLADIIGISSTRGLLGGTQMELNFGSSQNDLFSGAA